MVERKLEKLENGGWVASFTINNGFSVERVWEVITNEEHVKNWHPELRMDDLREGGHVIFEFENGETHKLPIKEFEEGKILGFDWYGSYIRFEVKENEQLLMTLDINEVNEQSIRDLTGWTMISEAIDVTARGEDFTFDKEKAKKIREEYERELKS